MDKLFIYLTDLSGGAAYFILFGILLACGLGFPLPEDIPLIAAGYLVWDGTISLVPAFLITMGGVLVGDTILYLLGYKLGFKFLKTGGLSRLFKPKKIRRTRAYFRKYGDKIVFIARFFAGFRAVAFFMSGAMHMKYRRFILLDALAAVLSIPLWIALGWALGHFFGNEIEPILGKMKEVKTAVSIVLVTVVAGFLGQAIWKYWKAREASGQKS